MNSGKDLSGSIIQYLTTTSTNDKTYEEFTKEPYAGDFKINKFADKLKDMICVLINCTRRQLEDRAFKETPLPEQWDCYIDKTGKIVSQNQYKAMPIYDKVDCARRKMTPRLMMQLVATECFRNIIHPETWIISTMSSIMSDQSHNHIITDVRFHNEADTIKQNGGIIIKINRPSEEDNNHTHESETQISTYDKYDYIIDNEGSINDLIDKIKNVLISEKII